MSVATGLSSVAKDILTNNIDWKFSAGADTLGRARMDITLANKDARNNPAVHGQAPAAADDDDNKDDADQGAASSSASKSSKTAVRFSRERRHEADGSSSTTTQVEGNADIQN